MHLVRDELSVPAAAQLSAQLPELLRGMYFEGWTPEHTPRHTPAPEFARRFAVAAGVHGKDSAQVLPVLTARIDLLMSGTAVDKALGTLRADLRELLRGAPPETG